MTAFQKITLSAIFFLLGILPSVSAQNSESPVQSQSKVTNYLSCEGYGSITYNGHTIDEFNATKGILGNLKQLVGPPTSINTENSIIGEVTYIYNGTRVTFRESELKVINITTTNWPVSILGNDIRIGTSFSSLEQRFGSNLITTAALENPKGDYAVSFNCDINEADGLNIEFNSKTDRAVQINYWVNP